MQGRVLREDLGNWESDFDSEQSHRYHSINEEVFSSAPCSKQSAVMSVKIAQGFIQFSLENFQGWRPNKFFGQHVPLLDCPHGEKVWISLLKLILLVSCPPVMHHCQEPSSIFLMTSPHRQWGGCWLLNKSLQSSLLSRLNKPWSLTLFLLDKCFRF